MVLVALTASLLVAFTLRVVVVYIILAAFWTIAQRRAALLQQSERDALSVRNEQAQAPFHPPVDVIIPCYNESPARLAACCESLANQDYRGALRVYLVDNGSSNREELLPLYRVIAARAGWSVLLMDENVGKRRAQDNVIHRCRGDIVVMIDSDTTIAPEGIRSIVDAFQSSDVGAASGRLLVLNRDANLLTRLICMRYDVLFDQERAAQGRYNSVLCCSGAFSAYRRSVLDQIWPQYIGQRFFGRPCTYGDDIHLTNLVLANGWHSCYVPTAEALTVVPSTLRSYFRQQARWNRSFYRQLLWVLPMLLQRRCAYLFLDVAAKVLLPALLVLAVCTAAGSRLLGQAPPLSHDLAWIGGMLLVHGGLAVWQTRRPLYLFLYALVYLGLLIPARLYAILTLHTGSWGTRTPPRRYRRAAPHLEVQPHISTHVGS